MRQLVGSLCGVCGQKIGSIIDGGFCPVCGCSVHTACAKPPVFGEDAPSRCERCGATAEAIAAEMQTIAEKAIAGKRAWKPGMVSWVCCVGLLLVSLCLIGLTLFGRFTGITTEENLTLVEGVPSDVEHVVIPRRGGGVRLVKFKIGLASTSYSEDDPNYESVLRAVESHQPLRAWVSAKGGSELEKQEWVQLYKLEARGEMLLDYEMTVAHEHEGERAGWICSIAALVVTVVGFICLIHYRKKYKRMCG